MHQPTLHRKFVNSIRKKTHVFTISKIQRILVHQITLIRTFSLAKGEFFMWAAYDDLWDQTYIRKCVQKLKQYPDAVMCVTEYQIIDEEGKVIGNVSEIIETINLSFSERLHQFFLNLLDWLLFMVCTVQNI